MEFQGTAFRIMPETKGTSARGEWQRQEVIFETMDGQYARKVAVTFFNRPGDVANIKEGMSYNLSVNIESREYNGRWYTDVRAWRVLPADGSMPQPSEPQVVAAPQSSIVPPTQPTPAAAPSAADDVDDLPF